MLLVMQLPAFRAAGPVLVELCPLRFCEQEAGALGLMEETLGERTTLASAENRLQAGFQVEAGRWSGGLSASCRVGGARGAVWCVRCMEGV